MQENLWGCLDAGGNKKFTGAFEYICIPYFLLLQLSTVWLSGLECCFYDGHDRKVNGSTPI